MKKRKRRAVPRSLWAACDGKHTSKRFLLHLLPGFLFSFYFSKHTFPSYFLSSSNLVPFPLPHYCVVEDLRGRNLGCTTRWCEEERLGTDKKKTNKKVPCYLFNFLLHAKVGRVKEREFVRRKERRNCLGVLYSLVAAPLQFLRFSTMVQLSLLLRYFLFIPLMIARVTAEMIERKPENLAPEDALPPHRFVQISH